MVIPPNDRGPTKYFQGRGAIRKLFLSRLNQYDQSRSGSTFLITGAPGAGKSALLDVLGKDATQLGWRVKTNISPAHFARPAMMADALGVKYTPRKLGRTTLDFKILRNVWYREREKAPSVTDILHMASKRQPLLLVLDEAQHVETLADLPIDKAAATATLDAIHNGEIGFPLILLAGGLDTSEKAMSTLGVSRITAANRVRLGPMRLEEAEVVIRDYVHGEFGELVPDHWIGTISEPTHGWPQHIVCYANAVGNLLLSLGRAPKDSDLDMAIDHGRVEQVAYYAARAHDITRGQREILAHLFNQIPWEGAVRGSVVINALCEKYSVKVAEETFDRALRQGVLSQTIDGDYQVPIPSMQQWLVDEYGPDRAHATT
ncbi:MAG: ATP-binding protein [Bacteroidetes bacterium]|nr:ATP-binding protein [Bacteroidota bacterium]